MVIQDPSYQTRYIEQKIVHTHKTGSIMGILIGGLISVMGVALLAFGLTGSIEWLVKAGGLSSKIINASPGLIVVIAGVFLKVA